MEENRKVEEIGKNPQDIAVSKDNNENNLGKEANKKKVESIKMKKENVPNDEQNGGKTKTEEQKNDMYFYLDASKLPKLDSTICENIYTPAVHDRANKIAHDHLIIDPKYSEYRGNIDMLSNELKQNKLDQFEKDLENNNKSEATVEASKKAKEIRVKVREDKCVVFETNEIPTDDEEDEGQAQE
ncbi:unnamed protein product [Caenorhabditis angaria]|uniref:Uncharacterized protein n=1 Tax=Caenorhabditis angaria TaxID=860376 RepID=A0A9P1I666_9PELO|nr:unnamed protein product [Caenorhabditis angaria]